MSARRLLCSVGLSACLLVVSGCDVIDVQAQTGTEATFNVNLFACYDESQQLVIQSRVFNESIIFT